MIARVAREVLRTLAGLALATACLACAEDPTPPNVLLYVVDTLRADALPVYGNEAVTAPHTALLAREGVVFERTYAPSSWTRASVGTILTGLPPVSHGAVSRPHALAAGAMLLSERFRAAGHASAAIVGNPNVGRSHGFDRGWDHFVEGFGRTALPSTFALNDAALAWLDAAERPFFLFVLAVDPHEPYLPPAAYDTHAPAPDASHPYATDHAKYLGEVDMADAGLGQLLDALRERGELDDTIVAFTSDHGEEFGDHGLRGHGKTVFEEVLRVPLILRYPARVPAGERITAPVALEDLPPTLLSLAGVAGAEDLAGRALFDTALEDAPAITARIDLDRSAAAARIEGRWKIVVDRRAGTTSLFDLAADPHETHDLADVPANRQRVTRMKTALEATLRTRAAHAAQPMRVEEDALPDATQRALEALGYLEPGDIGVD